MVSCINVSTVSLLYFFLQKIDQNEIVKCIIYGKPHLSKYPPSVRKFCFALNYHSPAAYRIVRDQFEKNLPHPITLVKWLSNSDVNGEHGFREETMKRLRCFVNDLKKSTGEQLICTLMLDEMYIRKQIYWDQSRYEYTGYPTYPAEAPERRKECVEKANPPRRVTRASNISNINSLKSNGSDLIERQIEAVEEEEKDKKKKSKSQLATRVLVFLLSGVNKSFEFPFGYHFVNGLDGQGLSKLVNEVICKISECGVKILNLTFDGAKENIKMCEILGANLDPLSGDFKPSIISPYDESTIYIILDPSHMEKLVRNLLGNHGLLFDQNDEKIEWKYFVDLQKLSKDGNLLTHKLTKKHTTEFVRNKMNVRLAVETFSTSCADSFKILRELGQPNFVNSHSTEKFTRMIDKIFDVLNSRDTRHSNVYKRPLNFENKREIFEFIEESIAILKCLKMNQTRKVKGVEKTVKVNVLQTINKTPILGFIVDLTNIPLIYAQYIENDDFKMSNLRTYAMSQDRIELLFGKIRCRNGNNNNPNCLQFKGAYRRLLTNTEIRPPSSTNCMLFDPIDLHMFAPQSNVYTVTSRRPKFDILSDVTFQNNLEQFEQEQQMALTDLAGMSDSNHLLEGYGDASIAYASKLIEESILNGNFRCDCCKFIFTQNEKLNDRTICMIPDKRPCRSTYKICKIVDKYMNLYRPSKEGNVKNVDFRVIYYQVFKDIDYENIYVDTNFKDHETHLFYLVKMIVKNYLYIKTAQISKDVTYDEYERIIRTKLTKWIHFQGQ